MDSVIQLKCGRCVRHDQMNDDALAGQRDRLAFPFKSMEGKKDLHV